MTHFIKEFEPLDPDLQARLTKAIQASDEPFRPSLLYSIDEKKKFLEKERRSSVFRLLKGEEIFGLSRSLVKLLTKSDSEFSYHLVPNDVTHIRYGPGDFFEPHEDYLSTTSNLLEEFTMIVCLDAECEGGETVFHLNPHLAHPSRASVTPGHIVIFRKDLKHEGALLKSGFKEIALFNLWAIPKTCDQPVVIRCKDFAPLILPHRSIKGFPSCMLNGKISFEAKEENPIIDLLLDETSPDGQPMEAFHLKLLERILQRAYLHYDEVSKPEVKMFLDGMGFGPTDLLVDYFSKPLAVEMEGLEHSAQTLGKDILLAKTQAELKVLSRWAKETKAPALPFTFIFAEGSYFVDHHDGDFEPDEHPMHLMYGDFGDVRHLFEMESVRWMGEREKKRAVIKDLVLVDSSSDSSDVEDSSDSSDLEDSSDSSNLEDSSDSSDLEKEPKLLPYLLKMRGDVAGADYDLPWEYLNFDPIYDLYHTFDLKLFPCKGVWDPAVAIPTHMNENQDGWGIVPEVCVVPGSMPLDTEDITLRHYTLRKKDNKSYLTRPQQQKFLEAIKDQELVKRIQSSLPSLELIFPQVKTEASGSLCNETAYSKFSLVIVQGLFFIHSG